MISTLRMHAAFRQTYLFDDVASPMYPEDITDADLERRIKVVPNLLAIYTPSDGETVVQVDLAQTRTKLDAAHWRHIVEAPLAVPYGRLVIANPESHLPDAARVSVAAGSYRVRVAGRGFGEGEAQEYLLTLWPANDESVAVIKSVGAYAA